MRCPACDHGRLVPTADLGEVPVLCGVTWPDADGAVSSPRGRMRLAHCPRCAHVVNTAFDPGLITYDPRYDNSLHHSGTFAAYATGLARRLAADVDLRGRTVLEPGCGSGEFLTELCSLAGARGVGYDPGYQGPDRIGDVRFVRGLLEPAPDGRTGIPEPAVRPDFLLSRHVLEHLADPHRFLVDLRRWTGDRPVRGYVEVPNAGYDFATAGWDCIYPHVSYFNADSLVRLVRRAGYHVLDVGTAFDDIFLWVDVVTNPEDTAPEPAPDAAVPGPRRTGWPAGAADRQLCELARFGARYSGTVRRWRDALAEWSATGARVVLWGAGARGVAFLNAADPQRRLAGVVDLNPRKWGRHLPVTGHRVCPPDEVARLAPSVVVITNPAYRTEIGTALHRLGVTAEVRLA